MGLVSLMKAVTCSVFSCKMLQNCRIIVDAGNFLRNLVLALMFPNNKKVVDKLVVFDKI